MEDSAVHGKVGLENTVSGDGRAGGQGQAKDVRPEGGREADVLSRQPLSSPTLALRWYRVPNNCRGSESRWV